LLLTGLVALWPGPKEPEYEGMILSEWLYADGSGYTSITLHGQRYVPAEVIREFGTNAVPCLAKWISYEEPWWRKRLYRLRERMPGAFQRSAPGRWILKLESEPRKRRSGARLGILILRADAAGAVPAIYKVATNSDSLRALMAIELLEAIGDPAVPALNRLTNAPDKDVRAFAFDALSRIAARNAASKIVEQKSEPGDFYRKIPTVQTNTIKNF
jgi:hypothetical protein